MINWSSDFSVTQLGWQLCFSEVPEPTDAPDPCAGTHCSAVLCDDGTPAPVPEGECCGDRDYCPDPCAGTHCSAVLCDDGSEAPIPEGNCCGDLNLCPDPCRGTVCPEIS